MAKKVKKKKSGSKKKSGNIFTKLIIIALVLVFAFFMVSKFVISNKDKKVEKKEVVQKTTKKEAKKVVDLDVNGAWISSYDQSTLTIKNGKYCIYVSGIERDHPFIGTCTVEGNTVTFVNKKDPCEGAKGLYEVSFNDKNIVFKHKDDGCSRRKAILLHDWERLDIDLKDITIE